MKSWCCDVLSHCPTVYWRLSHCPISCVPLSHYVCPTVPLRVSHCPTMFDPLGQWDKRSGTVEQTFLGLYVLSTTVKPHPRFFQLSPLQAVGWASTSPNLTETLICNSLSTLGLPIISNSLNHSARQLLIFEINLHLFHEKIFYNYNYNLDHQVLEDGMTCIAESRLHKVEQ